jgi:hypothetical protein
MANGICPNRPMAYATAQLKNRRRRRPATVAPFYTIGRRLSTLLEGFQRAFRDAFLADGVRQLRGAYVSVGSR